MAEDPPEEDEAVDAVEGDQDDLGVRPVVRRLREKTSPFGVAEEHGAGLRSMMMNCQARGRLMMEEEWRLGEENGDYNMVKVVVDMLVAEDAEIGGSKLYKARKTGSSLRSVRKRRQGKRSFCRPRPTALGRSERSWRSGYRRSVYDCQGPFPMIVSLGKLCQKGRFRTEKMAWCGVWPSSSCCNLCRWDMRPR